MRKKDLRSGYTTGACAAAAAKAAALLLSKLVYSEPAVGTNGRSPLQKDLNKLLIQYVEIPFPDGSRVKFRLQDSGQRGQGTTAWASVIKDAGDDPDVTNGAEIVAEATLVRKRESVKARKIGAGARDAVPLQIIIKGGQGVGIVTKPGLSVPVGAPAINPVPRNMIEEAVGEVITQASEVRDLGIAVEVKISVPNGEELAKKTLNHRLGIIGGISILGTTGIVKPVSSEAWTATISSSMDVAKATGCAEIVLSAGRSSEKAHLKGYILPEESYVLMGDYLEYSLCEARQHGFKKIHLCAQWAKMLKIAMATPQTHVRFGAIDIKKAVAFLNSLGVEISDKEEFNTAREMYEYVTAQQSVGAIRELPLRSICNAAKTYAEKITAGIPVVCYLVSYQGEIVTTSE